MNSMKNQPQIIFLFFLFFSFSFIQAQEYFVGLKGGVNYNTIGDLEHLGASGTSPTIPTTNWTYTADKALGNHYGAYVTVDFGQFFIRPELIFSSMKNSYALSLGKKTSNWTANKMDIPILIGYNIYKPVSIYAGPVFSSISDMKMDGIEVNQDPIDFDKNSSGIIAGVLIQYKRFGLDLRYEHSITPFKRDRIDMDRGVFGTNVAHLEEYNPSQLSVSLTVDLFHFSFDKTARTKARYDWRNHKNLR